MPDSIWILIAVFAVGGFVGYSIKSYRAKVSLDELNRILNVIEKFMTAVTGDQKVLNDSQKNLFELNSYMFNYMKQKNRDAD